MACGRVASSRRCRHDGTWSGTAHSFSGPHDHRGGKIHTRILARRMEENESTPERYLSPLPPAAPKDAVQSQFLSAARKMDPARMRTACVGELRSSPHPGTL